MTTIKREAEDFLRLAQKRHDEGRELATCQLDRWHSPALGYPRRKSGRAEICGSYYGPGFYQSFGIRGYDLIEFTKRCPGTLLKIDRKVWMVDDPWHLWAIEDMAAQMKGRVLVGGLGLGLIVWALAANENVDEVVVIERERSVIDLVGPELEGLCQIIEADLFEFIERPWTHPRLGGRSAFDDAFVDLWVTSSREETRNVYLGEVVPLALEMRDRLGVNMYALGFTGIRPVLAPFEEMKE